MFGSRKFSFTAGVGALLVGLVFPAAGGMCGAEDLTSFRVVPIGVSGIVVDGQGRSLRGVAMTVNEGRQGQSGFEMVWTRRLVTLDGAFDVECQDCSDLRLSFRAEGFYPKELGFKLTEEEARALLSDEGGDGFSLARRGLVVRLEAVHAPVSLKRTSLTLDLVKDGPLVVLAAEGGRTRPMIEEALLEKRRKAGGAGGPAMVALKASPGQFESLVQMASSDQASPEAGAVFLDFSGDLTGVIPVDSSEGGPKAVYHGMIEAPEDGYVDRLMIDPRSDRRQYFYCRIGGLFGKGSVSSLRTAYGRDSVQTLEVGLEIYLNPDGSRNLDSLNF